MSNCLFQFFLPHRVAKRIEIRKWISKRKEKRRKWKTNLNRTSKLPPALSSSLARLKQLCAKNQIDTSTRKQKEERKGDQRVSKGGRSDKKSTAASSASPVADDAVAGADA